MSNDPLLSSLAAISAAVAERNRAASEPGEDWGGSATAAATAAHRRAEQMAPEAADNAAIPLSQLARAAAAETRMLIEEDPALPNLERRCWIHLGELSALIPLFVRRRTEYAALRDAQEALARVAFRETVGEVWGLLRDCTARARPPSRPPRARPSDDQEYYCLRTGIPAKNESARVAVTTLHGRRPRS